MGEDGNNMEGRLTVLGSTGSIGRQTLEVAEKLGIGVAALAGGRNVELMELQARQFKPKLVALQDDSAAADLMVRLRDTDVKVIGGEPGVIAAAEIDGGTLVSAIVGIAGLIPTMAGVKRGDRRIALANKETLVCAGSLFMSAAAEHRCEIIPVDSEHSAIFQCLKGWSRREVRRLILTASGGPFLNTPREELASVTIRSALRHPNWDMGAKITVDSATMMNKGLEVMEAMHLFNVPPDRIKVVVHPQSVVHSAVEFADGAVIAQMGLPDMRLPIQLALTYPHRLPSLSGELDLAGTGALTFMEPDLEKFDCLRLAMSVAGRTDAAPVVLNSANEIAVTLFLEGRLSFTEIGETVAMALEALGGQQADTVPEILQCDRETRRAVLKMKGLL